MTTKDIPTIFMAQDGAANGIYLGKVSPSLLEGAYFFFGFRKRPQAGTSTRSCPYPDARLEQIYKLVDEAVSSADEAGRVGWYHGYSRSWTEQFQSFLSRHDLPEVSLPNGGVIIGHDYASYAPLELAMKGQKIPMRVFSYF